MPNHLTDIIGVSLSDNNSMMKDRRKWQNDLQNDRDCKTQDSRKWTLQVKWLCHWKNIYDHGEIIELMNLLSSVWQPRLFIVKWLEKKSYQTQYFAEPSSFQARHNSGVTSIDTVRRYTGFGKNESFQISRHIKLVFNKPNTSFRKKLPK